MDKMKHKGYRILALVLLVGLAVVPADHTARAAAHTVSNTNDSGTGSLRQAIINANSKPGPDTISFDIPACGPVCTIQPASALPTLTGGGITVDGYTQPGALPATDTTSATLKIEIDGTNAGTVDGLNIRSAENVIRGLVINRFWGDAIIISDAGTTGTSISGNYIGTDASGTGDLGNGWYGIVVGWGAQNNTVGGDTPAERNVISGNDFAGVYITGSDTTGNTVSGNYIGTDASGTGDLGNAIYGLEMGWGSENNTIGGNTPGERNVISGNDLTGVYMTGSGTTGNVISGNYIGTDASGMRDLANTYYGIEVGWGVHHNTIGGDTAGERNVISGTDGTGIAIFGDGTSDNTVSGNYIGTDASGAGDLGNWLYGVELYANAQNNTISQNVVSGNDFAGVAITGSDTAGNTVADNYIGTDATGKAGLGNTSHGVYIFDGARNNTVGPDNVIAYNGLDGVAVDWKTTTGNAITQNSIFANDMGIDLTGGANGGIAAPVIVATTVGSLNVEGSACAGCTVEVFQNSDTDGEGETYMGGTTAGPGGAFSVQAGPLNKPYLTATATDALSGTSEFSAVFTSTVTFNKILLPLVWRNDQGVRKDLP